MKKRLISRLLLGAMLLSLASCGSDSPADTGAGTDTAGDSTPADTEPANPYGDNLPEKMDLGGYEFRVLIYENGNTADPDWSGYIDIETETGEKLNDAAYQRNLEVEERLNVNISCIEKGGFQSVSTNALYPAVMAQEDLCDLAIFGGDALAAMPLISDGCLVDFNSIGAMDLDAPYYLQSVREVFDIGGTLPYISGDYLCLLYSHSYLFTNMDKWREMKLEDPYTLVREGKWTIDKCFSIVKNTWQDLNGNTTADPEDFWGITGNYFTLGYCFHSGGGTLAVSGDDGWEFPVASERNVDLLEKINAQFSNPDVNFDLEVGVGYRKPYFEGRSLMFFSGSSIRTIREAEFLTGVLPFPKYDEEQEGYISILNNALASVPVTVSDTERTGTVIEALFSASRRILRPAFFDTYVEQKILRDDDSVEMYSIILDSGRHNFTSYIDPSNLFGGYNLVYNLLAKKSADLTSAWESIREGVEGSYKTFFAGLNS